MISGKIFTFLKLACVIGLLVALCLCADVNLADPLTPSSRRPSFKPIIPITADIYSENAPAPVPVKDKSRYETPDHWRNEVLNVISSGVGKFRAPPRPHRESARKFGSIVNFLEQTLVADYSDPLIEDIFLMFKTGGETMWQRTPVHLFTTLTRVKNFALYSDMAGSIGGYEVIDILERLPEHIKQRDDMASYRLLKQVHDGGYGWDPAQIDFGGESQGWNRDKYKNILMLHDAYQKSPHSKWFVMIDDDTFIYWDNLAKYLKTLDPNERYYLGSEVAMTAMTDHDRQATAFAHGGSGVVISKGTMDLLFGSNATKSAEEIINQYSQINSMICCGDISTSMMLFTETNTTLANDVKTPAIRFQGEPQRTLFMSNISWCEPVISFHHVTSHDIEILWEYERLKSRNKKMITYMDMYYDFYLPYIVDERENWYMGHQSIIFDSENNTPVTIKDETIYANASKVDCKHLCQLRDDCLQWSYWEGTCQHQDNYVVLGHKLTENMKGHEKYNGGCTAGWMVDRIRQLRAGMKCDPLEFNGVSYNDNDDNSEGWLLRKYPE